MAKPRHISKRGSTLLTCAACGKEFLRPNAHIRNSTHACSRKCSAAIKPRKPAQFTEHICRGCGKLFRRRLGFGGTKEFCSMGCARPIVAPKGENHPRWKGGVSERPHSVRKIVEHRIREIGQCERCGSQEALHGHHKRSYSESPELRCDPSNIEVLCSQCHADEHPEWANMIRIPRVRSGSYIKCEECGTERYVPLSLRNIARFCSRKCQRHAIHRQTRQRPLTGTTISCQICGAERYVPKHALRFAKYCSHACAMKGLHARRAQSEQ